MSESPFHSEIYPIDIATNLFCCTAPIQALDISHLIMRTVYKVKPVMLQLCAEIGVCSSLSTDTASASEWSSIRWKAALQCSFETAIRLYADSNTVFKPTMESRSINDLRMKWRPVGLGDDWNRECGLSTSRLLRMLNIWILCLRWLGGKRCKGEKNDSTMN
jgi:hypothetical protein